MKLRKDPFLSALPLLLLSVSCFFIKLSQIPIRIWDEARNANNALQMLQNGNWLVPYYENAPDMWNTKPPLLIWIQVVFLKLFGSNEFAVRLPSAIAATLTVFVLWNFGRKYFKNQWAGFFCGAVLATSMGYVQNHSGRTGDYDALLILFITIYCTRFFSWLIEGRRTDYILFWIFLILAVLTKGIVGVMMLPGLFLFTIIRKKFSEQLRNRITWRGAAFFLLIIGGYYLGREMVNPGYLQAVYQNELGGRYLETLEQHQHHFGFYWDHMKEYSFTYWFPWILPVFITGFILKEKNLRILTLFNLLMVIPFFLVISSAGTKLEWYVLPVFPFLALQTGGVLYRILDKIRLNLSSIRLKIFLPLVLAILVFAFPFYQVQKHIHDFQEQPWDVEPHQPGYFLKHAMKNHTNLDGLIIIYEGYTGQIQFYTSALAAKGQKIQLHQDTDGLQAGNRVLVNQQTVRTALRNNYGLKILEENSGCTLYLVLSRYE